jgi:transformation/transcription domain-associated protein
MTTLTFLALDIKIEAANQLYENIEHYVSGPIYAKFLKKCAPIFINCLNGPPVFISTSPEQVGTPRSIR